MAISKPNGLTTFTTSSDAVKTTTRSGVRARRRVLRTSINMARARPARADSSSAEASRCFAFRKSLTGNRTVLIDDKPRQPGGGRIVGHKDIRNLDADGVQSNGRRE